MVYYFGISLKWPTEEALAEEDGSRAGYHIPQELYLSISSGDTQSAVDYVLRQRAAYQNHPESGANQCLAVIVAIYDRLGAENAFRFYRGLHDRYLCCANILEVLTDLVLVLWPEILQSARVELLTLLLNDVSRKTWSLPADTRIDTGYKVGDRTPNTRLALTYHPVEMMIVHDMVEKLRNKTELAHYQHELGELETTPEWAKDFANIDIGALSGVLRSKLRRDSRYKAYADWRRGTGFKWNVYSKPKDELTNWAVLKKQEYAYDYFKEVLTRSFNRDEDKFKADEQFMNYYRYLALKDKLPIYDLDKKHIVGAINKGQLDELFDIITGVSQEIHYDMGVLKTNYDKMQTDERVYNVTRGILKLFLD